MNRTVVAITPDESAAVAARLLSRHNIGALPVCTAQGCLRGMITDRDLILRCAATQADFRSVPVRTIMTHTPVTVSPQDDPRAAAQQMAAHQVRRLPVVSDGVVVGILSLGDLAQCGRYEMELSKTLTEVSAKIRRP